MRQMSLGVMVILGSTVLVSSARAQTSAGFSDPFYLYYGWFLPRQQFLANRPGPELLINQNAAARSEAAFVDREALSGMTLDLGDLDFDPLHPFGTRGGISRIPRRPLPPNGISNMNLRGQGPSRNFTRVESYYPGLRVGQGPNINVPRLRGRGSGVGSMGSMVGGMMGGMY